MYTNNRQPKTSITVSFGVAFGMIAVILAIIGIASVAEGSISASSAQPITLASYTGDANGMTGEFQMQSAWKVQVVCDPQRHAQAAFSMYLEMMTIDARGRRIDLKEWDIVSCAPGSTHTFSIPRQSVVIYLDITCSHDWKLDILQL